VRHICGSVDRLLKKRASTMHRAPARRRFCGGPRMAAAAATITGCLAKSAGSMSTSMITSGSTTGRAPCPPMRLDWKGRCRAPRMIRVSRSTGSARSALMARSQIAARPLLRFWSLIPTASCCAPGAVRPIPVSSAANVRRRQAASGQTVSTVFTSTRKTTSGSREIPRRQRRRECRAEERRPGQRTRKAATALY
jgi:hypothetical protein